MGTAQWTDDMMMGTGRYNSKSLVGRRITMN